MDKNARDGMLEISLVNDLREIAAAAAKIDAFCEEQGLAPQTAYALNLSIDEILTNTISYGYDDDEQHRIGLSLRKEGDVLVVEIRPGIRLLAGERPGYRLVSGGARPRRSRPLPRPEDDGRRDLPAA